MTLSIARPISDSALTRAGLVYLLASPVAFLLYLGMVPGTGPDTIYARVLLYGMMVLPLSLMAGPILAGLFHALKWRRATWAAILFPAFLIGFLTLLIVVAVATPLDGR